MLDLTEMSVKDIVALQMLSSIIVGRNNDVNINKPEENVKLAYRYAKEFLAKAKDESSVY